MKTLTCYGECPNCGQSCQPDTDRFNPETGEILSEYAVCCDCQLIWSYIRGDNDPEETWYEEWEPTGIQTFDEFGCIPYECEQ